MSPCLSDLMQGQNTLVSDEFCSHRATGYCSMRTLSDLHPALKKHFLAGVSLTEMNFHRKFPFGQE